MKHVLLAAASAAALAFAASAAQAQAQDTWTGFYGSAHVAASSQSNNNSETLVFDRNLDGTYGDTVVTSANANAFSPGFNGAGAAAGNAPAAGVTRDDEDAEFGVKLGYDWQTGAWVLGGVVEYAGLGVTDSVSGYSTTPASYTFTRELNSTIALRGRAGYVWGAYLPYVTAGIVRADVDHSFATTNTANSFTQSGTDDSVDGYQVGIGLERRFEGSNWAIGGEYLFTSLDDGDYTVRAGNNGTTPATNPFLLGNASGTDIRRSEDRFDVHSFRLTASYRF